MDYEPLHAIPTPEDQAHFASDFFSQRRGPGIQATGFKVPPYQVIDKLGFSAALNEVGVKTILVLRRDVVRTALSQIRRGELQVTSAKRTGVAHTNLFDATDRPPPSRVDFGQLSALVRDSLMARNDCLLFASRMKKAPLTVSYEDMMADLPSELSKISAHLGVAIEPRPGDLLKNTPDDLREAIANYDEILSELKASGLERYMSA